MTKHFSRTPADLALGLVAIAPAIAVPLLFLAWVHSFDSFAADPLTADSLSPFDTRMIAGFLAVGALHLTAIVAVIRDVWVRPLPQNLRIVWTVLCLFAAPCAGLVYWVVQCRSVRR